MTKHLKFICLVFMVADLILLLLEWAYSSHYPSGDLLFQRAVVWYVIYRVLGQVEKLEKAAGGGA